MADGSEALRQYAIQIESESKSESKRWPHLTVDYFDCKSLALNE